MNPSASATANLTVSVAIPVHNAAEFIRNQIEAIQAQDEQWLLEVVAVDNASTDGTAEVLADLAAAWPKLTVVTERRPGGNVARNTGVRLTTSDFVLLCDADDVVGENWLVNLRSGLTENDIVRGRYELEHLNSPDTVAARGPVSSTAPPPVGRPISGLGGNCGFHRSVFDELGGLAEHHYGSDEEEFFWRADLAGYEIGYIHEAVVHYRLRPSLSDLFRQQRSWASNRAQLYKEFGQQGFIARRSVLQAARSWAWIAVHVRDARSPEPSRRGRWARVAATSVGNLRGSIKHRVVFP